MVVSHTDPEIGSVVAFLTYFSYAIIIGFGHIRDFIGTFTGFSRYVGKTAKGYAILLKSWESFYIRRLYHRIQDCWNRPICSAPGCHIEVLERVTKNGNCSLETTRNSISCLNLGSYNYLGFADDWKISCRDSVVDAVHLWPLSMCSSRADFGTVKIHDELEKVVADFVGKESAIVYTMGYGTNLTTIPCLLGPESLLISDSLNHLSIVNGARSSTAQIRVFKHDDPSNLEEVLREAIINGQPRYHRPWKKIVVMVEGIYSMEGGICKLPEIVKICKKYKAYVYVDEAHSIGALGKTGRGICEYRGVNPKDIDILMGTFTKSFSGMGGYIAASNEMIDYIRSHSAGILYHNSLSPIVAQQILTAFRVIRGEDGTNIGKNKLNSLINNSNYFRSEMIRIGLHVYGDFDNPIVPVLIYTPCKIAAFSRECLKRGVAVVVVGFPATSVILSRARFCISAGHTKEDLDKAISVIDEVATLVCLKYNKSILVMSSIESQSQDDSKIQAFLNWLTINGAIIDNVKWPHELPTGRGAIAVNDINTNEYILQIPVHLMMSPIHAYEDPDIGEDLKVLHQTVLKGDTLLTVYFMNELRKGIDSFYYPYINILPIPNPISEWLEDELNELQIDSIKTTALSRNIYLSNIYKRISRQINDYNPEKFPLSDFTFERFKFCYNTIQARAFGKRLPWTALVPFADCLNHSNLQTKYDYNIDCNNYFRLFPTGTNSYTKGTEVFNSYGRRHNENLLIDYGFAMLNNEWDEFLFKFDLSKSDPHYILRQQILLSLNISSKYEVYLSFYSFSVDLIKLCRVSVLDENEVVQVHDIYSQQLDAHESPINDIIRQGAYNLSNEITALNYAITILKHKLDSFPTTILNDENLLDSENSYKLKISVVYRLTMKYIIQDTITKTESIIKWIESLQNSDLRYEVIDEILSNLKNKQKREDPDLKQRLMIQLTTYMDSIVKLVKFSN